MMGPMWAAVGGALTIILGIAAGSGPIVAIGVIIVVLMLTLTGER